MTKNFVFTLLVILLSSLASFSQTTNVPDDNFENYLETHDALGNVVTLGAANSMGNGIANDDLVLTNRINMVTILNVSNLGISDLTGISDFTALTELACANNNLISLDVSANTALEVLGADNLPFLAQLNISNGNNSAMIVLVITSNPNLACITVDNQTIANNWNTGISLPSAFFMKDPTSYFSADCSGTFVPDNNFENYLETHDALGNVVAIGAANSMGNGIANDDFVLTNRINMVTILNINSFGISDLTGIADFAVLTNLYCASNNLTNIDVSTNVALTLLECSQNQLTSLDVSANTALVVLGAVNLPFLTRLNIANGNNSAMIVLAINNNPNLGCITVDNQTIANNWNSGISLPTAFFSQDPTSSFSADCGGTFVPDNNFENYLETHDAFGNVVAIGAANSMGNGIANDNYVITERINTVTALYVLNQSIADLTGIEDFALLYFLNCSFNQLTSLNVLDNPNLGILDCGSNQLTSLDVSANTNLTQLYCHNNQITSLDVSASTSLTILVCGLNQLTNLDVSTNTGLQVLRCEENQLTSLDLSANTALTHLECNNNQLLYIDMANGNNTNVTIFNSQNNPDLPCIQVDNIAYSNANWTNIDPSSFFSTDCNLTIVPDNNFENYLETHSASGSIVPLGDPASMGNGFANDNFVQTGRINSVLELNISGRNISDLTGIEDFTLLSTLNCSFNQLTSIDVTANTGLTQLACWSNQLTTIALSGNPSLTVLECGFNQLTSLNLSDNSALAFLNCNTNNLTYLNIANGNNINFFLPFGLNTENNPDLTCIEVDDAAYAATTWSQIDPASSFSEDCDITQVPDDNFENYLETHDASGAVVALGDPTSMGDGTPNNNFVPTSKISGVTSLNILGQSIADLTGIEDFTALEYLSCIGNQLTSLDVTANTALTDLYCRSNRLTSLDVSQNTALTILDCGSNQLPNVDVSLNTALTQFSCRVNQLTSLDISANTALEWLSCRGNQLTSLDLSTNTALITLYCFTNQLTSLDVSTNTNVTYLECYNNQLEFLDVSNGNNTNFTFFDSQFNPNLTCITVDDPAYSTTNWTNRDPASAFSADCGTYVPDDNFELYLESHDVNGNIVTIGAANSMGNGITNDNFVPTNKINTVSALNLGNQNIEDLKGIEDFTALQALNCNFNALTTIDLSQNTALVSLGLFSNTLSSLDISKNTQLTFLDFGVNAIESIDLSSNLGITALSCSANPILEIDLSMLSNLDQFFASSTPNLTSINLVNGNNSAMTGLLLAGSPNLFCVEVDNQTIVDDWNSGTNLPITNFDKDPQTYFSLDCSFNDTPDRAYTLTVGQDFVDQAQIVDNTNASASELLNPSIPNITECDGSDGGYNGGDLWYQISIPADGSVIIETGISGPLSADTVIAIYSGTPGSLVQIACNDDFFVENFLSKLILTGQTPSTTIYARVWSYQNDIVPFEISAYRNPEISTYVPDDNFETYLETHDATGAVVTLGDITSMGNGFMDDYVSTDRINTVSSLSVSFLDIRNLTGIEHFTALETLFCFNNLLTTLNVSANASLKNFVCSNNDLSSLDVSSNTELVELYCDGNPLTSLNLANGNNTMMSVLRIENTINLTCVTVDNQTLADDWNSGINLPLSNYAKDSQTQFSANCGEVVVEAKAYLQGAFLNPRVGEEAFMRDDLRALSHLPTVSPYDATPLTNASAFTVIGADAIVDWVWVELRDNTDNTIVIDGQSALLQRDGDIVAPDGVNPLVFAHPAKYYKVVVKHRNHLGIMTGSSAAFPKDRAIDFKTGAMSSHGTNGEVNISGTFALWAGNVNNDGIIQYAGTSPDTSSILSEVLNAPGNFLNFATYVIDGYNTNDINMDGKTQYTGTNPDSPFVLQNVLTHPGNFLNFSTHQILEQLPEN